MIVPILPCAQFLRLGFHGYRKIMTNLRLIAKRLRLELEKTGGWVVRRPLPAAMFVVGSR